MSDLNLPDMMAQFRAVAIYRYVVLILKANEMHYFSDLFDKVLYMFRTSPLSIMRSISTLYTRSSYLSC